MFAKNVFSVLGMENRSKEDVTTVTPLAETLTRHPFVVEAEERRPQAGTSFSSGTQQQDSCSKRSRCTV